MVHLTLEKRQVEKDIFEILLVLPV